MIHTVIRIDNCTHTYSYLLYTYFFVLISRKHRKYTIVLIPTEFLPCALVSNCYLVKIFFIPIICEKFEFTLHAHSWSFANIIVLCRLGSIHVVFLSYYYQERTKLKWKIYMIRALPNRNWCEFQTFYIRPRSSTDSAQWDWGIIYYTVLLLINFGHAISILYIMAIAVKWLIH